MTAESSALSSAMRVVVGPISESRPPITPPSARSRVRIGDHEHLIVHRAFDAVERPEDFAWTRAANHEPALGEPIEIERVHRLSELEQHVVRDVDDVVDGPDASGFQPFGEPGGGGPHADLEHLRAVARTAARDPRSSRRSQTSSRLRRVARAAAA